MEVKNYYTPFFENCFKKVLEFEGEYSNHPADKGGKTKFGIIEEEARKHGYDGDMKDLPLEFAKKIYFENYFSPLNIEKIYLSTNENIAYKIFDIGVNMGISAAGKIFQKALNFFVLKAQVERRLPIAFLIEDGKIGKQTLQILQNFVTTQINKDTLYKLILILQGKRYLDIIEKNPTQVVFLQGWLKRV